MCFQISKSERSDEEKNKLHDIINLLARDNARTPVQRDATSNGGFTTGIPWMKTNDNFKEINVASQKDDPESILSIYKKAIAVRRQFKELLVDGAFEILDYDNDKVFRYTKTKGSKKMEVILNFSNEQQPLDVEGEVILSNIEGTKGKLAPYEAKLVLVSA